MRIECGINYSTLLHRLVGQKIKKKISNGLIHSLQLPDAMIAASAVMQIDLVMLCAKKIPHFSCSIETTKGGLISFHL